MARMVCLIGLAFVWFIQMASALGIMEVERGCNRRVTMTFTCSMWDVGHCNEGLGRKRFVPNRVITAIDRAFGNNTNEAWWAAITESRFLNDFLPEGVLLQAAIACPPLLVASSLLMAAGTAMGLVKATTEIGDIKEHSTINPSPYTIRALMLAEELSIKSQKGTLEAWHKHVSSRWPNLEEAPSVVWLHSGCIPRERITFSGILSKPIADEDRICIYGDSTLSREYLIAAESQASDELQNGFSKTFRAAKEKFMMRPVYSSFRSNYLYFFEKVLDLHLKDAMQRVPGGLFMEFGVSAGAHTLRILAKKAKQLWESLDQNFRRSRSGDLLPAPVLYGFDLFTGLPRGWFDFPAGTFGTEDGDPPDISDIAHEAIAVEFVKGSFDMTLPSFLKGLKLPYKSEWRTVFTEREGSGNGDEFDDSNERTLDFPKFQSKAGYEVRIEWGWDQFVEFTVPPGFDIFDQQQVHFHIPVTDVKQTSFKPHFNRSAYFCHGCIKDATITPGDTCWALVPRYDRHRQCGCSSPGWQGNGIYYGGYKKPSVCSGQGGGFSGPSENFQPKGNLSSIGMTMKVKQFHPSIPKIAFLHLDADLYESTKDTLRLLAPFVTDGTLLVMDDVVSGPFVVSQNLTGFQNKEIWEALSEAMMEEGIFPWKLEVLGTPWDMHTAHEMLPARVAFRVRPH
eukprot:TRINITY_DN9499_c0_g1_i2.p1 TRINITY_DN9499_c0_g1~~TRINITY_DN9499_c0_g1_i2.p1  ORF type:complete len:679 (+),score=105.54 TRINITY_DN9499_c0_g1_i2:92-2128(+)